MKELMEQLKELLPNHAYYDLIQAKNWSTQKKNTWVRWVCDAIRYNKEQGNKDITKVLAMQYMLYLELTNQGDI